MDHAEFLCVDCKFDTRHDEYYMVHDAVWAAAGQPQNDGGMLCIGCLEKRLGRQLTREDFPNRPINMGIFPQSQRLQERLHARRLRDATGSSA